jgi:ferritin
MKDLYTKEELIKSLIEDLDDELEGIINYEHIYESFKALGMHREARDIERIATDEYDHVVSIWDMLTEHGADVMHHENIKSKWAEVKHIFALK